MAYRLVTCPETAHLELIEHDNHPLGMLVRACTRYCPAWAVECPRTCAARLDRRDLQVVDVTLEDPDAPTASFEVGAELSTATEDETLVASRPRLRMAR